MIINTERALFAPKLLPNIADVLIRMLYIMPRWSPESARICDAPLLRNAVETSFGMPVRSPVMSAEIRPLVELSVNGMLSITDCILRPMSVRNSAVILLLIPISLNVYVSALMHPHPMAAIMINIQMTDGLHSL